MPNQYGFLEEELIKIRARDKTCVYCHKHMVNPRAGGWQGHWATIEHLNYQPPWNNPKTVAICCLSCNSSRGAKQLKDWFRTVYCKTKNININTVAEPVKKYIKSITA